jgi:hypothetical protein
MYGAEKHILGISSLYCKSVRKLRRSIECILRRPLPAGVD